jgi:hypothetical protein
MKIRTALRAGGAVLLLAGMSGNANACEMWRDAIMNNWHGLCNLTLDPKAPKLLFPYIEPPAWPLFRMPDLVIRRYSFFHSNGTVEVTAYVTNIGAQNSSATNVGVSVTTIGVTSGTITQMPLPVRTVNALAPMAEQQIYMGLINVATATEDVDLVTTGMADQLTVAQPVRGTIFESNENNNALAYQCRVYGPNPVIVVPSC